MQRYKEIPHAVGGMKNYGVSLEKSKEKCTFRYVASLEINPESFDTTKVKNISRAFQKRSSNTHKQLRYLRDAFSYTVDFVDAFLEVDNSLHTLIGYLTGNDSDLQLEAAWCITNISATDYHNMITIVKAATPYLITYLQSGSVLLQDQSAWALGNMASDNEKVREMLHQQGIVSPLVDLLKQV